MLAKEAQFKKLVNSTLLKLKRMFGYYMWTMNVFWRLEESPHLGGMVNGISLAACEVDECYLTFSITIYRPLYDEWIKEGHDNLVRTLTHEMVHVIVNPLYGMLSPSIPKPLKRASLDMLERTVEHITILLCNPNVDVTKLLNKPKLTVEKKARKKPRARKSSKARP